MTTVPEPDALTDNDVEKVDGFVALLEPMRDVASHPVMRMLRRLTSHFIAPSAQRVDQEGVDRDTIVALAEAGVLGVTMPVEHGGSGASVEVGRAVTELLSESCGSTWFVVTQHKSPTAMLLTSDNTELRARLLKPLCTGDLLAGVATSHLRREGPPAVSARRADDDGGWIVDGFVSWMTSWGLCDVFLLGAQIDEETLVFFMPQAKPAPGLTDTGPLALAAMSGTATTQLKLDGFRVDDADVVTVMSRKESLATDLAKTANVTPAVFGCLRAITKRLAVEGKQRNEPETLRLASMLSREGTLLREDAYNLMDGVPAFDGIDERLKLRAEALELLNRAGAALVAAGGGAAMALDNPAQRLAREALFHMIQAQTGPVRAATMRRYREQSPPRPDEPVEL